MGLNILFIGRLFSLWEIGCNWKFFYLEGNMAFRMVFIIVSCICFINVELNWSQELMDNITRAKIGILIKSGDRIARARPRTRLKSGDSYRIYIQPEDDCMVYIIHTDEKTASILNMTELKTYSAPLILPSENEYFQVKSDSSFEKITIICSPRNLPELSSFKTKGITLAQWGAIEDDLIQESRIMPPPKDWDPISIAGNVRTIDSGTDDNQFFKMLQIYSGKGFLLKQYDFQVKK